MTKPATAVAGFVVFQGNDASGRERALDGAEAVILSGDRRMVMDDAVSRRLTLRKGPNVVRGAVINGPGMSDFCVRFIDERGEPVRDLTLNLGPPQER